MNKAVKFAVLACMGLALSVPAWSATKYGDARIDKGKLIVLREGHRLSFDRNDETVPINHEDVVRLGENSRVVLSTVEKATITLGSNAVLHVKPWQRREQKGFFRMLFGRMRAKITGLMSNERFNVQSATATIGVKGTEETIIVNVQGDSVVGVTENAVQLGGLDGKQLNIPEGRASAVVGGITPQVTFPLQLAVFEDLESPIPTSRVAIEVPLKQILLEQGVFTKDQIEQSECGAGEKCELPGAGEDALDDATEDAQDAAQEKGFPTAPVNIRFEN